MYVDDTAQLVDPETRNPLRFWGTNLELLLDGGKLIDDQTGMEWPVAEGLPRLYRDEQLRATDQKTRNLHDGLPKWHDKAHRWALPVLQLGAGAEALAAAALDNLALHQLTPGESGHARVLEVGVGTGRHLDPILARVPPDTPVALWGCDTSIGLLRRAQERIEADWVRLQPLVKLLMADAHRLPFVDDHFDRCVHLGGLFGMHDPQEVVAEMARVTRPGGRVMVVAKQQDPNGKVNPLAALGFQAFTLTDRPGPALGELVPAGAQDVQEQQLSPFFRMLHFEVG